MNIRLVDEEGAAALYETVTGVDLSGFGLSTVGFSAVTGASTENHDVLSWMLTGAGAGDEVAVPVLAPAAWWALAGLLGALSVFWLRGTSFPSRGEKSLAGQSTGRENRWRGF